jgi:hypothetical protein
MMNWTFQTKANRCENKHVQFNHDSDELVLFKCFCRYSFDCAGYISLKVESALDANAKDQFC